MLAFIEEKMVKFTDKKQIKIEDFIDPIQKQLNENNRWVKLSYVMPWDKMEKIYCSSLTIRHGRPSVPARIVIGSLIIKHKLKLSDEETISMIQENSYMQYFLGLESYRYKPVFTPSLFVTIRKRLGQDEFDKMTQSLIDVAFPQEKNKKKKVKNNNTDKPSKKSTSDTQDNSEGKKIQNKGSLLMDATVAEQAIKYPTDLDLLNESREISEKLIDQLYEKHPELFGKNKPRTYRRAARKAYLSISKQKKTSSKTLYKANRQQLNYLRRNLKTIEKMLDLIGEQAFPLAYKYQRKYWIIKEVYRQQREMNDEKKHQINDRIVSISQPHVRPIVRGKKGQKVEFGPKIGAYMIDEIVRILRISWDAYNESKDLIPMIEQYQLETGYYPEKVHADTIFGTQANRKYMKERGIQFIGKPLGRPKTITEANKEDIAKEKARRKKEYNRRIPIEGKFGQGKNGYNLDYIRAKTKETSESWISCIFFIMNVVKIASKKINSSIYSIFLKSIFDFIPKNQKFLPIFQF